MSAGSTAAFLAFLKIHLHLENACPVLFKLITALLCGRLRAALTQKCPLESFSLFCAPSTQNLHITLYGFP